MRRFSTLLAAILLFYTSSAQNANSKDVSYKAQTTFHKKVYSNEYPLRKLPVADRSTYSAKEYASRAPMRNPKPKERVWFPGEWEEVQAVIITPMYDYRIPGYEDIVQLYATPVIGGLADYYYEDDEIYMLVGAGPYIVRMDTISDRGKVFFHLMDGIQTGGAQAWVHVEEPADTVLVYETLERMNLRHDNLRFFFGPGNSVWYRDCGPICFYYGDQDSLAMLDFVYSRHRRPLDDSIPSLLHRQMGIPNYMTGVFWEGGNCLVDGAGAVVSSDAVYTINADTIGQIAWNGRDTSSIHYTYKPALTATEVKQALHDMLGQRATIIVPRYLYDGSTGHIDLYADAYDENGFVFSEMPSQYSSWVDYATELNNIDTLCSYNSLFDRNYYLMGTLPFPSDNNGKYFKSQEIYNKRYSRSYSNHTFVNNVILQPCFSEVGADGMPTADWDRANIEAISKTYPGYTIYCVDIRSFDGLGGAIHCVTKQIPADNPIRILHKNIHDTINTGIMTSIPVSAIITNRNGIEYAELNYRKNSGQWQTVSLTGNGNRWYGEIPLQDTDAEDNFVEYWFKATSTDGKSITKPITAANGGYYSFSTSRSVPVDSSMFDFNTDPMPMEKITFEMGMSWLTPDTTHYRGPATAVTQPWENVNPGQIRIDKSEHKIYLETDLKEGVSYTYVIIDMSGRTLLKGSLDGIGSATYPIGYDRLGNGIFNVVVYNTSHRITYRLFIK